jgi:hypothetical protein
MDCERILYNEIVGIMQSIVADEMTRLEQQGKLLRSKISMFCENFREPK